MTLQLSGRDERLDPHAGFYGRVIDTMPRLLTGREDGRQVDVPRTPASFAYILERRETAPTDVREQWENNYFFTGDAVICGTQGDVLSVLDAALLRELTPQSTLRDGALVLTQRQWDEIKDQKEGVLYLSAKEVAQAHQHGYVFKKGKFVPTNQVVAKVWDHLSRGRDLAKYAQRVREASQSKVIMSVKLDFTNLFSPSLRSWVADSIYYSNAIGSSHSLNAQYGRQVGVVPEAFVAGEKVLERRVLSALESKQ